MHRFVMFGIAVALAAAIVAAPTEAQDNAEKVYLDKCANCHGADGAGQTVKGKKLELKDVRSAQVQKMTDAQMTELIMKGKGDMPPYAKELDDKQVKALVAYIRTLAKSGKK